MLTLLLVYDYFPIQQLVVSKTTVSMLLLVCILISLFFQRYTKNDRQDGLKWQAFITIYILCLIGIFSLLGGESSVGISFHNGFFWIVLLISLAEMFFQWKKPESREQ
ncbi:MULTISPECIES: hypothetical protein [Gracilibacillus]|uniref:hypothetical protein n=1 Tax=Gracilibacillus TaxID=74385 RepID=UPI000824FFCC|nr:MULTISPECIES: hypothetical protein [Gracilibacillus]